VNGWLAALRIARREARRAKGRSALVLALIGLPVLALSFLAASYDMFTLTAAERLDRLLGAADAQLTWSFDTPANQVDLAGAEGYPLDGSQPDSYPSHTDQDLLSLLPAGSRVSPRGQGETRLATATRGAWLPWHELDLADPLTRGIAEVTEGRAPGGAGELALTATAADQLGVRVGERVEVPDDGEAYTVVGVVEFPGGLGLLPRRDDPLAVFHPGTVPGDNPLGSWLVDTPGPVGWEQQTALNRHGILVHSRAVALDPPAHLANEAPVDGTAFAVGTVVAGLAGLEIVLLAGPAFAVSARRRTRDLGLVAAGGGTPAQLRRIVLAEGLVLGALAAGAGIALGVAAAIAARPLTESLVGARAGGYRVFPLALAAIAALAIGTGLLAALAPAATAARQQVVDALAGRRGVVRSRRRWLVLGVAAVGFGTATAGLGAWEVSAEAVLAGLVLAQLGLVLCTPTLVGLVARLGRRLPLAPRIALRDTGRNRAAAAPAVSAVMAAVAGAVAAGVVLLALDDGDWREHVEYAPGTVVVEIGAPGDGFRDAEPSDQDLAGPSAAAEQVARATLPVDRVYVQHRIGCAAGDGNDCPLLATLVPPERVCPYWELLDAGPLSPADERAAARDPRCDSEFRNQHGLGTTVDDGTGLAALVEADPGELAAAARVLREGGAVVTDELYLGEDGTVTFGLLNTASLGVRQERITVPGYLLAAGAPRQGAIVSPAVVREAGLALEPGNLLLTTTRLPTRAEEGAFFGALQHIDLFGWVERPVASQTGIGVVLLAVAAGVVALGAAGIATGLAAAERRQDLSTLAAVGASPRVRRSLSLSQSGVIAGLGTGLGLVAGLGGAIAVLVGLNQRYAGTWPAPDPYPITVPWLNLLVLLAVPVVAMLGAGLLTRSRLPIERRFT
jgi:putative ABC transport system permease protein